MKNNIELKRRTKSDRTYAIPDNIKLLVPSRFEPLPNLI